MWTQVFLLNHFQFLSQQQTNFSATRTVILLWSLQMIIVEGMMIHWHLRLYGAGFESACGWVMFFQRWSHGFEKILRLQMIMQVMTPPQIQSIYGFSSSVSETNWLSSKRRGESMGKTFKLSEAHKENVGQNKHCTSVRHADKHAVFPN